MFEYKLQLGITPEGLNTIFQAINLPRYFAPLAKTACQQCLQLLTHDIEPK